MHDHDRGHRGTPIRLDSAMRQRGCGDRRDYAPARRRAIMVSAFAAPPLEAHSAKLKRGP